MDGQRDDPTLCRFAPRGKRGTIPLFLRVKTTLTVKLLVKSLCPFLAYGFKLQFLSKTDSRRSSRRASASDAASRGARNPSQPSELVDKTFIYSSSLRQFIQATTHFRLVIATIF